MLDVPIKADFFTKVGYLINSHIFLYKIKDGVYNNIKRTVKEIRHRKTQ